MKKQNTIIKDKAFVDALSLMEQESVSELFKGAENEPVSEKFTYPNYVSWSQPNDNSVYQLDITTQKERDEQFRNIYPFTFGS